MKNSTGYYIFGGIAALVGFVVVKRELRPLAPGDYVRCDWMGLSFEGHIQYEERVNRHFGIKVERMLNGGVIPPSWWLGDSQTVDVPSAICTPITKSWP